MNLTTAKRVGRGLMTCLFVLVAACGGGAGGGTKTVTVDFRYADVQSDTLVPLSVVPILTGLDGRNPTCTLSSGVVPPGMTFNTSTCAVTGTPTVGGAYTLYISLTVEDVQGSLFETSSITIIDPTPVLSIDRASLGGSGPLSADMNLNYGQPVPPTSLSTLFSASVARQGDVLTYALAYGSLPSGIALDPATGKVQGTPTGFGVSTVGIAAALTRNGIAYTSQTLYLTLGVYAMSLSISYPNCLVGVGTVVSCAPQLGNPAAFAGLALAYTATGLPAGVSIDPASGVISGLLAAVGDTLVFVNLRAMYPNGAVVDVPNTTATLRAADVIPFYEPTGDNVGVRLGPSLDGLGDQRVVLQPGQAFAINVTSYNLSVPGDVNVFTLVPWDASSTLPSWVSIDASTGRVFGIAPVAPEGGSWRVRLVTTRGGVPYSFERRWVVSNT